MEEGQSFRVRREEGGGDRANSIGLRFRPSFVSLSTGTVTTESLACDCKIGAV